MGRCALTDASRAGASTRHRRHAFCNLRRAGGCGGCCDRSAADKIKTAQEFKLAGKPTLRIDVPAKVDGSAVFGIDMRLPGMLYAAVVHCPVFGGKVKRFDFAAIKDMPGVRSAVDIGSGVAVVEPAIGKLRKRSRHCRSNGIRVRVRAARRSSGIASSPLRSILRAAWFAKRAT